MTFIEFLPHFCRLTALLIFDIVLIGATIYKLYQINH